MSQVVDTAESRLDVQRSMAQHIITQDTTTIGLEQEEQLGMDEIARLTQTRYGFSPFMRIYVGDRVTGMIVNKDEQGRVIKFRDIDRELKPHYVTRTHVEPCALNIFNNVTRRISKDKAVTGVDMPGASVLEKNGPLAHHIGSKEYGADIANYRRANQNLRSETKYAEWIVKELEETYAEFGFVDLAPLIGIEAEFADALFKVVLPQVTWVQDPARLPGERVPHLPNVLRYLRVESPQNIDKLLKAKEKNKWSVPVAEQLLHTLQASCQAGLKFASTSIVERAKQIKDAGNSRPGPSDYGLPQMRAFLAKGEMIPTESYGVAEAIAPESDPELKEAVKAMAAAAEKMAKTENGKVARLEKDVAELRAGIAELLAAKKGEMNGNSAPTP